MTKIEDEPRIGAWIENGMVWRSDIGEERPTRVPTNGHTLEEVLETTRKIQETANEGKRPKPGMHIPLDDLIDHLNKISTEKDRFI